MNNKSKIVSQTLSLQDGLSIQVLISKKNFNL